jgi:transcriptional regulator with XRE-family HTH domain
MPSVPYNHDAHDYGERIRARLPRRLQELREAAKLSKYGLARESGLSREYIGKLERGAANPTLPVTAQISHGLGMTLEQFTGQLEDVGDDDE